MKKQISKHELRAIIMSVINEALLNGHDFHINIDDIHDRAWHSLKDDSDSYITTKYNNCGNCIDKPLEGKICNMVINFPNCWRGNNG